MRKDRAKALIHLFLISGLAGLAGGAAAASPRGDYCQILDYVDEPLHRIEMAYLPISRFEGHRKTDVLEVGADWELFYLREVFHGTMDLDIRLRDLLFFSSAGVDMPTSVMELALDLGWVGRYEDGLAFQWRVAPGLYSDAESLDSGFYMPFSLAVVQAFNRRLSGMAGFDVRPGFRRWLMPRIGLEWEAVRELRLEIGLPRSRLLWFVHPEWTARLSFEWQDMSYALHDDRDRMTLADYRVQAGASYRYSDQIEFMGDIGRVFNRSVNFQHDGEGAVDIDPTVFVKFGVGASF